MNAGGSYIADGSGVTLIERTRDHELGNRPRNANGMPVHQQAPRTTDPSPQPRNAETEAKPLSENPAQRRTTKGKE